ncbi:hypothetical protein FSARC_1666 [Fusarium sarcochroum]|uniref:DUF7730 domain-containing protein n=1 Tax=Fusarium sarcochroum TaxID=1208366 RepID=A0A8H4XEQ0_9HYPO|nr:hypothetical protein FSARC_1666 [Fusarium sarcochroum]
MDRSLFRERQYQLPPAEQFRRDVKFTSPTHQQRESPFFTTLPAEIRRMIYIELFGSQLVHVYFRQYGETYDREGAPSDAKIPGWVHCVCRRGREAVPHCHDEENHKWCYLSASILRTCQLAYIEGIPTLYQTNILSFRCPRDIISFQVQVRHFSTLLRSIDLYISSWDLEGQRRWIVRDPTDYLGILIQVLNCLKNVRFYFECEIWSNAHDISKLQPPRRDSPMHQHFFLPGDITEDVDEEIQRNLKNRHSNRIIKVTANAKELLSGCYGEPSDVEDEDYLPSSSDTDDSDTEKGDSEDSEDSEVEGPSWIMLQD